MPWLAPGITARRPSSRKEGRSGFTCWRTMRRGLPRSAGCRIKGMKIVYEALVERIRRINVDAVGSDDMIVLKPDASYAWLSGVRFQIKSHSLLEHHRRFFRGRAEVGSVPRINAGPVSQTVENVGLGCGENLSIGR